MWRLLADTNSMWDHMFGLTLPWVEKILRPVLIYLFLVIGIRLGGKRELAQLNPLDLIVLLTLSNTLQNAIIGDDTTVTGGIVGAIALMVTNYLFVRFLYNHERLERIIEGAPDKLIQNGRVRMDRLKKELITLSELEAAAHKQGFGSLSEVETATLEPGGTLSFVALHPQPVETRQQELLNELAEIRQQLLAIHGAVAAKK